MTQPKVTTKATAFGAGDLTADLLRTLLAGVPPEARVSIRTEAPDGRNDASWHFTAQWNPKGDQ